eukprot:scaffold54682_cov31-Tisochrysis_lutea.AAC.4
MKQHQTVTAPGLLVPGPCSRGWDVPRAPVHRIAAGTHLLTLGIHAIPCSTQWEQEPTGSMTQRMRELRQPTQAERHLFTLLLGRTS